MRKWRIYKPGSVFPCSTEMALTAEAAIVASARGHGWVAEEIPPIVTVNAEDLELVLNNKEIVDYHAKDAERRLRFALEAAR